MKDVVYRLAITNNPDLIIRAAEISEGLWEKPVESLVISVSYRGENKSEKITVPVLGIDPFRLVDPYLVNVHGEPMWIRKDQPVYISRSKVEVSE